MKTPQLPFFLVLLLLLAGPLAAQSTSRQPQNRAAQVCPDTQLALTFAGAPTLGNTGQIRIYDAADNSLVDTIDASVPAMAQNYAIGSANNFHLYPVLINGNTATIFPHAHKLDYRQSYYVQMDAGVLAVEGQPFPGFSGNTGWVFTTKDAAPAADAPRLVVAADSTGDFATVQGAVDFAPAQPAAPVTIFLRKGLYVEIVNFTGKSNLTFLGEDRTGTVVGYPNNAKLNAAHRGSFNASNSPGLNFINFSFINSTPKGGSQAETLILSGGKSIISHCNFSSLQDTIQINGSAYFVNSFIEGDVDFMWGNGPDFFQDCELKALNSKGYFSQIRNPAANHGYIYNHCTFSAAPGVTGMYLSRIAPSVYPASEVVLLDCALGPEVNPVGWLLNAAAVNPASGGAAPPTDAPNVHFWEYNSTNSSDGQSADVSQRASFSKQLTMESDADTIKNYRDPAYVLNWTPTLAPIIITPVSFQTTTSGGASATTLTVTAAAVPAPTYQWLNNGVALKDGDGVAGATTSTLNLSHASSFSIGNYTVVVTNASGTVKSP